MCNRSDDEGQSESTSRARRRRGCYTYRNRRLWEPIDPTSQRKARRWPGRHQRRHSALSRCDDHRLAADDGTIGRRGSTLGDTIASATIKPRNRCVRAEQSHPRRQSTAGRRWDNRARSDELPTMGLSGYISAGATMNDGRQLQLTGHEPHGPQPLRRANSARGRAAAPRR